MLRMNKIIFHWTLIASFGQNNSKVHSRHVERLFCRRKISTQTLLTRQHPDDTKCVHIMLHYQNTSAFSCWTSPLEACSVPTKFTIWWQSYLNCKFRRKLLASEWTQSAKFLMKIIFSQTFVNSFIYFLTRLLSWTKKSWCKLAIATRSGIVHSEQNLKVNMFIVNEVLKQAF